jgi:Protein of unknown function (DUF2971)
MTEIYEEHPEIYHYTTKSGLKGILDTQTLWATHYAALNDTTEIRHMRETLVENLTPIMRVLLDERRKNSFSLKRKISKCGGLPNAARKEAESLVDVFYKVTFGLGEENSDSLSVPFAEPFITSFCSHDGADQYTKENGLLSQWRSYGSVEGFAIVFDTRGLCDLLVHEKETYHCSSGAFGDVIYDDEKDKIDEEFKDLFDRIRVIYKEMLDDISDNIDQIYGPFVNSVSRFKHRAFHEEREVRIISCPYTQGLMNKLHLTEPETWKQEAAKKKTKQVHNLPDARGGYIALFDFEDRMPLPIKRVIVGPQRNQTPLRSEVKSLVRGMGIDVLCSETPYMPSVVSTEREKPC